MDIKVVLTQMIVMFLLMLVGYFMYRKKFINEISNKHISSLIVYLFNPALLLSSALSGERIATTKSILFVLIIAFCVFLALILLGHFMPKILRVEKKEYSAYNLLTIFGNVGFIGIPVTNAIFGSGAVIYASLFNIPYYIFIYSYGLYLIAKTKNDNGSVNFDIKKIINVGTISSVLTIVLFLADIPMPKFVTTTFSTLGNAATPLSMMVLGVSLAMLPLKSIFSNIHLYTFSIIRLFLLPIGAALLLKPFIHDPIIYGVTILMIAMPCGSMPILLASESGVESNTLSEGVVLTTLLSLVSISIVSLFV